MKREILDHASHILSREATRTLSARVLHERTTAELGVEFGYAYFVDALASMPDRFTIVTERVPFGDGWTVPDADRLAAQLEHAGVLRCPTVLLADPPPSEEAGRVATDDVAAALAATLADAHAAVLDLLLLERAADATTAGVRAAVLELDELRTACAAWLLVHPTTAATPRSTTAPRQPAPPHVTPAPRRPRGPDPPPRRGCRTG